MAELTQNQLPRITKAYLNSLKTPGKSFPFEVQFVNRRNNYALMFQYRNSLSSADRDSNVDIQIEVTVPFGNGNAPEQLNRPIVHFSYYGKLSELLRNDQSFEVNITPCLDERGNGNIILAVFNGGTVKVVSLNMTGMSTHGGAIIPLRNTVVEPSINKVELGNYGPIVTTGLSRAHGSIVLNSQSKSGWNSTVKPGKFAEWSLSFPQGINWADIKNDISIGIYFTDHKTRFYRGTVDNSYNTVFPHRGGMAGITEISAAEYDYERNPTTDRGERNYDNTSPNRFHSRAVVDMEKLFKSTFNFDTLSNEEIEKIVYIKVIFRLTTDRGNISFFLYPQRHLKIWDPAFIHDIPLSKRSLVFSSYYIRPTKLLEGNDLTQIPNVDDFAEDSIYKLVRMYSVVDNNSIKLVVLRTEARHIGAAPGINVESAPFKITGIPSNFRNRVNLSKGRYYDVVLQDGTILAAEGAVPRDTNKPVTPPSPPAPFSINDIKQLTFIYDYRNRTGTAILNTTRPITGPIRFNVNNVPKNKLAGFTDSELVSGIIFTANGNGEKAFTMSLNASHFKGNPAPTPPQPKPVEPPPNPYGIRYLPPSDRARISIKGTERNNRYLIAYFHINERGEILLNIHGEWKLYSDDYLIARYQGGEYYHLDKVNKSYSSAYETYRVKVPGNISRSDAISLLNTDQLALFIAVESNNQINAYQLYPAVAQTASETTLMNLAKAGAIAPHIRYDLISRRQVSAALYRNVHPDVALNSSELSSLVLYTPSGIKIIPPSSITGNKVTMDVSDLHYDTTTGLHRLLYAVVWKDSHKIGGVDCFAGMSETGLDFSQFPVTPFPGVRYVQIGQDRITVGLGNNWYDRPLVRSDQPLGALKYTAEDNSTSTCTQTMDSPSPGTYYYANNKTSHGVYPKESADGSVTFTFAWDSGNGLQNHDVKLYKDLYIPGLYSIRPTYNYTNVFHHGHIATDGGSHWFALPGKFVETANLGTNVDYTERRKVLMNSVNNLTVSDNYVGNFWEEGRIVALAADIPYNNQSKQAPSKRINIRSQNSNKPYNYYYGNSFLKTNATFDSSPRSLNASIDYADEDKLPDINQDFTTNCGYNNSSRELSDWTVSRVYYDRVKRLRFGSENSDYSRVNYRGGVRNLTPDGITPLVDGIATLVNGGTIRVQSGTKSLFTNTPQCAVIEGDIIVDATGNSNEFPLELYKKDTLVAGVLIMRGRILIKGSENLNPFIGIRNPTLVINETQWDLNQLFAVMSKPRIPRNYRVIGGILRNGDGVIFVEDTKNLGIPASISSLRNMAVVNMGKTILSDKSIFMIAGNIHTAQIQDMGYFETASFGTCKLIDEISRHITQETIPFGYNGYESISFPYYLTPRIGNDDDGRYGYPEVNARQDIYNHALYTYDFTGKYYYTEERRGRYRKQYSWYYHTGTAEGFYDFVKNKMKTDDNRELINAKRILVSYEGASSNVVYKMASSIDEALRLVVWSENSRRSVSFYIFD